MGERSLTVDEQSEDVSDGSPSSERIPSPESRYAFAMRYGLALACANFNVWPDVLLLDGGDDVPHWHRIGLDRNELLFVLVVLRHYQVRGKWPTIPIDKIARYLNLAERRTQEIKNTLIKDRYIVRVVRSSGDGKRWPDGLDLSPLFGLLEACLYKYHRESLTLDVKPIWLPQGPSVHPLDPDDFGNRRRACLHNNDRRERSEREIPGDPMGALEHTHRVHSAAPYGCARPHSPGALGRTGTEQIHQNSNRSDRPTPSSTPDFSTEPEDRAPPPGGSSRLEEEIRTKPLPRPPSKPLPFNDTIVGIVEHYVGTFRDNDPAQSVETAHHIWWNSHLPLAKFVALLDQAALVTKQTTSRGQIRKGSPGARQAMPYFFAILRTLSEEAASGQSATGGAAASGTG